MSSIIGLEINYLEKSHFSTFLKHSFFYYLFVCIAEQTRKIDLPNLHAMQIHLQKVIGMCLKIIVLEIYSNS